MIVDTAYDTDGTVAIRFGSASPIRRANFARSSSAGAKKSSGEIACGKRLARSPAIPGPLGRSQRQRPHVGAVQVVEVVREGEVVALAGESAGRRSRSAGQVRVDPRLRDVVQPDRRVARAPPS